MPESKDDQLSMDQLKDVNGGISWDLPDTSSGMQKVRDKNGNDYNPLINPRKPNAGLKEDICFEDDLDGNDICK